MPGGRWTMRAFYGVDASAAWRRRNRTDRRIGPVIGGLAIMIEGPESVVMMDAEAARRRPDIGRVEVTPPHAAGGA